MLTSATIRNIVFTIFGIGFLVAIYFIGRKTNVDIQIQGIDAEFSSVVSAKWERRGIHVTLKTGPDISGYIMDSEMKIVEVGDSLIKLKGENSCLVIKPSGEKHTVKFIYPDSY